MKHHRIIRWSISLATALLLISFSVLSFSWGDIHVGPSLALAKGEKAGPPKHAKAHGYRAKHTYRYYPSANAYYDVERKAYFYLEGTNWRMGVSLPDTLSVSLGKYVTIEMDSDKPYTRFEEHKRQYRVTE
jgi:hypothetical protein